MKKYIISSLIIALACSILGCQSIDKQQVQQQDEPVVVDNINVDNYYVKGPISRYLTRYRSECL